MGFASHTHFVTVGQRIGDRRLRRPDVRPQLDPRRFRQSSSSAGRYAGATAAARFTTVANWRAYGSIEIGDRHYGQKAHSMRRLMDIPQQLRRTRSRVALVDSPGRARPTSPRCARTAGVCSTRATVAGTTPAYRASSRRRSPRSGSPRAATSRRAAAGSATAARAISPRGGRCSPRTPASASRCRPATACSRSTTLDEAVAAADAVVLALPAPPARRTRARRGVPRLRPRPAADLLERGRCRMSRVLLVCNQFPKFSESFIVQQVPRPAAPGLGRRTSPATGATTSSGRTSRTILPTRRLRSRTCTSSSDFDETRRRASARPRPLRVRPSRPRPARRSAALARSRVVASLRGNDINALGLDDSAYFEELWETDRRAARPDRPLVRRVRSPAAARPAFRTSSFRRPSTRRSSRPAAATGHRGRTRPASPAHPQRRPAALDEGLRRRRCTRSRSCAMRGIAVRVSDRRRSRLRRGNDRDALLDPRPGPRRTSCSCSAPVSQQDVKEQLGWADVLLHGAVSEGFCNAALEAQAMAVPVVCTEALAENVVDGKTGLVAPLRDPHGLADRLERIAARSGPSAPSRRRRAGACRARTSGWTSRSRSSPSWYRRRARRHGDGDSELRTMRIELRQASDRSRTSSSSSASGSRATSSAARAPRR